jgi:hypothetical protein
MHPNLGWREYTKLPHQTFFLPGELIKKVFGSPLYIHKRVFGTLKIKKIE